jgi:hypothetical protein
MSNYDQIGLKINFPELVSSKSGMSSRSLRTSREIRVGRASCLNVHPDLSGANRSYPDQKNFFRALPIELSCSESRSRCHVAKGRRRFVQKSANIPFPIPVAGRIARRTIPVGEEIQKRLSLSVAHPAPIIVLDGVEADSAGVLLVADFERKNSVRDPGFGAAFGEINGIRNPIGIFFRQRLSRCCQYRQQKCEPGHNRFHTHPPPR